MNKEYANAYPRKNFFIQMFTKDVSLEDCILDLIDNSIDGYIRSKGLKLFTISKNILEKNGRNILNNELPTINLSFSKQYLEISDNCGGIDLEIARREAFNFGHDQNWKGGFLGVYGIGLKRALFKIGDEFQIDSKTVNNGFSCHLNVQDWLKKDQSMDDWRLPLIIKNKAKNIKDEGTKIRITKLHDEVKMRLEGGTIDSGLYKAISRTYSFFINKYIRIKLNGQDVEPFKVPIGKPLSGSASYQAFKQDDVKIKIFVTLAEKDKKGHYYQDRAGWYIVCNGRVVLEANQSEISGWGPLMPTFQPKYRGFIGVVFFESSNPLLLPWTTDKRNLNRESAVYLRVRNKMSTAAKPVISFLNNQYPSDRDAEPVERKIASKVSSTSFKELVSRDTTVFNISKGKKKPKTTTMVQYEAQNDDLEKIRKHRRKSRIGANQIGKHTFDYYLDKEGLS
ncbi:MAG: hypothetical protein CMD96_02320 [Gammaproteobacteria bacterium]|nr:hypothetical protein [Gammaproteobacteria bacterium]|tara:strand:- start:2820 stop:4175 length:1356 start_codon:yes stop_codon:yes gene_type:complete